VARKTTRWGVVRLGSHADTASIRHAKLVGLAYAGAGQVATTGELARHTLLDFAELLLFLIPAMTFVNTLQERGLFDRLRA
jgi:hypothetical protein